MKRGEQRVIEERQGDISAKLTLELHQVHPSGGTHVSYDWKVTLEVELSRYIGGHNSIKVFHPFVQGVGGIAWWLSRLDDDWFMTAFLAAKPPVGDIELPFTRLMLGLCDQLRAHKAELEPENRV